MNECNHGQLARSCRECELEAEIAALRAQVAELTKVKDACSRSASAWHEAWVKARADIKASDDHFMNTHLREHMVVLCDENDALKAKLADCQAVIRNRGHDEDCDVTQCCKACGMPKLWSPHLAVFDDYPAYHEFQPGPCTCGHDRIVGSAGA